MCCKLASSTITFLTLFLIATNALAQSGTVSTGGDASGSSGSVSFSVGQAAYTFFSNSRASITAGLQQSYVSPVAEKTEGISVYPNPTAIEQVTLQLNVNPTEAYSYQLYDLQGRLLTNASLQKQETVIRMAGMPASVYILRVMHGSSAVKSFKIEVINP